MKKDRDVKKKATSTMRLAVEDLVFMPSDQQMKAKAVFWNRYSLSPMSIDDVTAAEAVRVTGDNRITRWWGLNGFKEWFLNQNEFTQKLEYLAHLALGTIEEILIDPDANANAKANMIKIVFEAASKFPKKYEKQLYLDESVQKMDKAQLESFLRQQALEAPSKEDKSSGGK